MIPTNPISPLTATAAAVPIVATTTIDEPHAADVDAERRGLLVADAQHVEQPPVQQDHDRADDDVRRDERDVVPAGRVEAAEDPAVDLLQRLRVLLLDERLDRGQERDDRHAGEHERRRAAAVAGRVAERRRRATTPSAGADERRERQQVVASATVAPP